VEIGQIWKLVRTDRQTDGGTDRPIPIYMYHLDYAYGGITNNIFVSVNYDLVELRPP